MPTAAPLSAQMSHDSMVRCYTITILKVIILSRKYVI